MEEERRILQEQLDALAGGKKVSFTADQRRRLATAGKALTPGERRKCCHLVKPATILAWFRQLAAKEYDSSEARRGRPPKPKDVRKLVIEMALANPSWGYTKIRDALRTGLGIEIGRTTVANIWPRLASSRRRSGEDSHLEAVHQGPLGFALCVRFLQRRSPRDRRDGSLHGLLCHRAQDAGKVVALILPRPRSEEAAAEEAVGEVGTDEVRAAS